MSASLRLVDKSLATTTVNANSKEGREMKQKIANCREMIKQIESIKKSIK